MVPKHNCPRLNPGRMLETNPIPAGWLPPIVGKRAKCYLYPSEDRQLMACRNVPVRDRMVYGILAREGLRKGELMALRWDDLDLERGSVRLDANKTDDPRAWALHPGVPGFGLRDAGVFVARSGLVPGTVPFSRRHRLDSLFQACPRSNASVSTSPPCTQLRMRWDSPSFRQAPSSYRHPRKVR